MSTNAHIDALVDLLTEHEWTATTPKLVMAGTIPDALEYPVIGVFSGGGRPVEETLDGVEWVDNVSITIAAMQDLDGAETNQAALMAMKDEIIGLIYTDPHFSDEDAVRGSSVRSWDRAEAIFVSELGDDQITFDYVTVHVDVRYAMDLTGN